jgi:plastocyanin
MRMSRRASLLALTAALTLALGACGGGGGDEDGGGQTGGAETGGAGGTSIVIEGFAFDPSTITVSGPTDITITNNDSASHTFTLDDGSVDETIAGGDSVTVTVDVSESTGFVCRFHPQMTGTVQVS